jgi:hypothetical protein
MSRRWTVFVTVALASFGLIVWWPTRGHDRKNVHPLLLRLVLPIRTASCSVRGDGGSLGSELSTFPPQKRPVFQGCFLDRGHFVAVLI